MIQHLKSKEFKENKRKYTLIEKKPRKRNFRKLYSKITGFIYLKMFFKRNTFKSLPLQSRREEA